MLGGGCLTMVTEDPDRMNKGKEAVSGVLVSVPQPLSQCRPDLSLSSSCQVFDHSDEVSETEI